MSLAIFDLDNTLIGGDSDYLWGEFLVEKGIVDGDYYREQNDKFYEDYKEGTLDIMAFLAFSLKPLAENPVEDLRQLRDEFMRTRIEQLFLAKSFELLEKHRTQGDTLLIITATNRFVTEPIATRLGVDNLLATDPKMKDGVYTGGVEGIPCFQEGKVKRLNTWLAARDVDLKGSWFYSDSHNDLPLLKLVENPVAVDADEMLTEFATQKGWPVISLR